MKAVVLDKDGISCRETEEPAVHEGQVKVKVAYCGICGSDIPRVLDGKVHFYPIILGHEFSGTVAETGEGISGFRIGDRVAGIPLMPCFECDNCSKGLYSMCPNYRFVGSSVNGAYAEYVCVPETNLMRIPDGIDLADASMVEPCSVARHAFELVDVRGKDVAVTGDGTIGLFAVQWAKVMGARNISLITHGRKELSPADLDIDAVVSSEEDLPSKADAIIDCAGTEASILKDLDIAAPRCTLVIVGTASSEISFSSFEWQKIARKEMIVKGSWMSYSEPFPGTEWTESVEMMGNGHIGTDMIRKTVIGPEDVPAAFSDISEGIKRGKILIRF